MPEAPTHRPIDPSAQGPPRWLRWGAPIGLFVLALGVRCLGWREVFGVLRTVPVGSDAYYHLRRMTMLVFRPGASLDFDAYLHFPEGARPIWPPLFDRAAAALVRPWVPEALESGLPELERLAMWIPPLLGALTVVAVFALARRQFGWGAGLLAGGFLAVLSGHSWYSRVGFLDHHVAVAGVAALLLAAGMELVADRRGGSSLRAWAVASALGALGGVALLLWPGTLMHVSLVHVALLAEMLRRPRRESAALAAQLAVSHGVALAVVAPAGLASEWPQWGAFSPVVPSLFQPWLFVVATLVCAGCALAWRSPRADPASFRFATLAGAAAVAALASGLAFPALAAGIGDAWRWLAKEEAFQSLVAESKPLLFERDGFSLRVAVVRLSGFVLLVPFALTWLAVRLRHCATPGPALTLLLFTTGLSASALLQRRFFHDASVGIAVVFAVTLMAAWRRADTRSARVVLAGLGLLLIAPTLEPYARPLANEWRGLRGEKLQVGGSFAVARAQQELATWLREHTPTTSGWLGDGRPEYGVLAPWPLGHLIQHAGRRPTIVDNFGDDLGEQGFAFAAQAFSSAAPDAAAALAERRLRYVVVQKSAGFLGGPASDGSLLRALYDRDGSGSESPAADAWPALPQHRFAFETKGLDFREREAAAAYKVFETVPGALLEGRASPGALVGVRLGVFTNRGRKFLFETHAVAEPSGAYRVRVPYATEGGPEGVRTAPFYRLQCGEELRVVAVDEAAVTQGRSLPAPSLCLAGGGS
jgi:dolichyl-diphosphooligosaccharide--protein glycosyltransferase